MDSEGPTAATGDRATDRWRRLLAALLALVLLNLLFTARPLWPTPWLRPDLALSGELALVVFLLAVLPARTPGSGRWLPAVLAGLFLALALGRYLQVTLPALYGRELNLYWDAPHLPKVAAMLVETAPAAQWLAVAALALVSLVGLVLLLRWAARALLGALAVPPLRRGLGAAALLLTGLFALAQHGSGAAVRGWFATPVSSLYARQAELLAAALRPADTRAATPAPAPPPPANVDRLAGADVLLVFFESYGAVTRVVPEYARALAPAFGNFAAAVNDTGREVVSAFVRSPTFGGNSWLAHASLLAGVPVSSPRLYDALLASPADTLVHHFRRQGYRTVGLMPGMRQAWPEGGFYGFDVIYDMAALAYQGPAIGWWAVPDQFSLARLHELEYGPDRPGPRFVVFPTITSHHPFSPVPPYQPDWSRMTGAQPFAPEQVAAIQAEQPRWADPRLDFLRSIGYTLESLAGYLRTLAPPDAVLIVVGDHQPPAAVSGEGATPDVPVHVATANQALLAALRAAGFEPGLHPRGPALGAMHELRGILLEALAAGAPPIDEGGLLRVRLR